MRRDNVRIVGFASCSGGTGCTTIALSVGQELRRFRGKKVLYISLEDIESSGDYMEQNASARSCGEYLYRLLGSHDKIAGGETDTMPFLDAFLVKNEYGIETFSSGTGKNPLRELNGEEMQRFMASLVDSGRFDIILADMSTCITDAGITAMTMADKICLISGNERNLSRERNYINQLSLGSDKSIIERMIKVKNMQVDKPVDDEHHSESKNEGNTVSSEIYKIHRLNSECINPCTDPLEGRFGSDISRLAGVLMDSSMV